MPLIAIEPTTTGARFPGELDRLVQTAERAAGGDYLASTPTMREAAAGPEPTLGEAWRARAGGTLAQAVLDEAFRPAAPTDLGFNPYRHIAETPALANDPTIQALVDRGQFDDSDSLSDFEYDLATGRRYLDDLQTVGRAGAAKGALTAAGAMIGDPVNLIPLGPALKAAQAGTTLARVVKSAAIMGGANLAIEKAQNALQPASNEPGLSNEALAAVSGAAFGAGLGFIASPAFKGTVGGWLQTRKMAQLRGDLERVLAEPVVPPIDPATVRTSADLANVTLGQEIASGRAFLERVLAEDPVPNRVVAALHRPGDENASLVDALRKKYADAGVPLHVADHPGQPFYDLTSEVRSILDHPNINVPAAPADFAGYSALDSAASALTTRYANFVASATPGGRLAESLLGRMQDVYRTLSGSATTVTRGAALDPLGAESPVAAENLKAVLEAGKESTVVGLRRLYTGARKSGTAMVYDGRAIPARFGYGDFNKAVSDVLRRENAAAAGWPVTMPKDVPAPVRAGADLVRSYFTRMGEEAKRVGLLPATADPSKYLPRVYDIPQLLARPDDFKARLARGFEQSSLRDGDRIITPDERQLVPELEAERLDPAVVKQLKRAKRGVAEAEEAGFKAATRQDIDDRAAAKIGDWKGLGAKGRAAREPVEKGLYRIFAGDAGIKDPVARFRSLFAYLNKSGRWKTIELVELDGRKLSVGDSWAIGPGFDGEVAAIADDGTLTIRVTEAPPDIPGATLAGDSFDFRVPETEPIVAVRETLTRAGEPDLGADLAGDVATVATPKTKRGPVRLTEGDLPPDVRDAYRRLLVDWWARNADAAWRKLVEPAERHGVVAPGAADHAAARTLTVNEADLAGFLVTDLERMLGRYHQTIGGRVAVRRAIQLNPSMWADARLSDGSAIEDGAGLMTYLRETVNTLERFAELADSKLGRDLGGKGSLLPYVRRIKQRVERDIRVPLDLLEGRNPLGHDGGLYASARFLGRNLVRWSYLTKMGSVAVAQLNDLAPVAMYNMTRPSAWAFIPRAILSLKSLPRRDLEILGLMFDGETRTRALADADHLAVDYGVGEGLVRSATAKAERGMERAGDAMSRASMMSWITETSKRAAGGIAIDRLLLQSKRLLRASKLIAGGMEQSAAFGKAKLGRDGYWAGWTSRMGLNAEAAEKFHRLVYEHGLMRDDKPVSSTFKTFDEYLASDAFVKPNMAEWPLAEDGVRDLVDRVLANLNGAVSRELVVTPGAFDRPIIGHSTLGRMFLQFQGFGLAFANQRLRLMAQMPFRYQAGHVAMYLMLGAMSDAVGSALSGRRSLEESAAMWRQNPLGGLYSAWGRSGLSSWLDRPVAVADAMGVPWSPGNALGAAASSTSARHVERGRALTMFGPGAADLDAMMMLTGRVASGQFDRETARIGTKLLPYQNLLWLRLLQRTTGAPVTPEAIVLPKAGR